ncbi:bifunctional transcriptional activator/DNA repair enzyme AdaA [Hoeflea prorocentri]|uniref:methylated-DNA--[protein]-cysteine S-methyltransferase n=1 Tax=Hoeflea prorocentri TaxID=1922333 RepID=A0A9X3ZHU8_9HYPH|nr:trifunctional transcriptional activator/DNA repair protein Ada/methylated-DNA--[protein]-cysteine S-methyltransferase [Hoeflea prorocentri]MCY6381211.1 trifunctional transcriptional activator/DNA repair protein Ada/methylated-DNA--[protein]-cysteine S-methyltransferase [Hoeflea prorocentri]MDA5399011.1 trifunctional transcriptional activator/DNA repair protein Ada/methylated-DNA--[protein]-cysteine S-methyltransferase [Hoeflea prorocentri]
MLFKLPDNDVLYQALVSRDASYDGRVFVGVSSTGIFCRLTCPARNPKRENCQFFQTVAACIEAGYRPCKRCSPLKPAAEADAMIADLLAALEADPLRRWSEGDIIAMGYDPSTVRRAFKRHFDMTFLEMARLGRLRDGFVTLSSGGRVIDAQQDAGFESASGFRSAFARLLGRSPSRFSGEELLLADWFDTPLGPMIAVSDPHTLHLLEFADRKALPTELRRLQKKVRGGIGIGRHKPTEAIKLELDDYFAGRSAVFETPLTMHGSPFTRRVWQELLTIAPGETRTYSDIARLIGKPSAVRAVARANGANQIALVIPCHRVLGSDGSLTGYGGGLWRKQKLIDLETTLAGGVSAPGKNRREPG